MKKIIFVVHYLDDFNKQHMAFVKTMREVRFIQDRFGHVTVETTSNLTFAREEIPEDE